jgi:hypothetical protein
LSIQSPAHSGILCAALAVEHDELLSELLVSALRDADIDARSTLLGTADRPGPEKAELISTVILPYPMEDRLGDWLNAAAELRTHLPDALLATVKLPFDQSTVEEHVDIVLRSFEGDVGVRGGGTGGEELNSFSLLRSISVVQFSSWQ